MADLFIEPNLVSKTKGSFIYLSNQPVTELSLLMSGKVNIVRGNATQEATPGEIIGLYDIMSDKYDYTYIAAEDCILMTLSGTSIGALEKDLAMYPNIRGALVSSIGKLAVHLSSQYDKYVRQTDSLCTFLNTKFENYKALCNDNLISLPDLSDISEDFSLMSDDSESDSSDYINYYSELLKMESSVCNTFYEASEYIAHTHFKEAYEICVDYTQQLKDVLSKLKKAGMHIIGTDSNCLFGMYCELQAELLKVGRNTSLTYRNITEMFSHAQLIGINKTLLANASALVNDISKNAAESLVKGDSTQKEISADDLEKIKQTTTGMLDKLLAYSNLPSESLIPFKDAVLAFRGLKDKNDTGETTTTIRKTIAKYFYPIYEAIFFKYVETGSKNRLVEMFLNTCLIDENLVSEKQLQELFTLNIESVKEDDDFKVYTMYEWLLEIFKGNQEPSRNEFDQDYAATIRDRKRTEKLTDTQVTTMMMDKKAKTRFEIQNFFRSSHRITCGQILGFCPILYSDYPDEQFSSIFVSKKRVAEVFSQYKKLDFSIFYRAVPYEINRFGLEKEILQKEVLPHIILNPIIGQKGIMWQELAGAKKDTPARFSFPILFRGDFNACVLRSFGQFRWELCKNIEGPHWSDIRQKSLTSEYFDYISYYKKNHEISTEAKEKIKTLLTKYHNNFKEVFTNDYVSYITYESGGASRLNKIARAILFRYCPFSAEVRKSLLTSPVYTDLIAYHDKNCASKLRRIGGVLATITNNGGDITPELEANKEFYSL